MMDVAATQGKTIDDGLLSRLGLQGKAVCPIMMGFGCTIGGACGSRVMDNWGQRMLTMVTAWAVPCASIWSVVPVVAGMVFSLIETLIICIAIILYAFFMMWLVSIVFGRKLSPKDGNGGMIMELPPFHKPHWGHIFKEALMKFGDIFKRAFIFACTFNIPCLMALNTTLKESHSLKWTAIIAGFYAGSALILSCIVYHIALLIF